MIQAIGYIRVSTDDQSNSIAVQTERINSYCKFQNIILTEIIIDEDVSGFTEFDKRPGGKKANHLLANTEAKTIIATQPERCMIL
jgi:DNA invertase Pin-like site-specific DNA recombinase